MFRDYERDCRDMVRKREKVILRRVGVRSVAGWIIWIKVRLF